MRYAQAQSSAPIRIGFQCHRTGIGASYGRWYERTTAAAVKLINEAVYAQAKELLGDRLEEVATSLMVSAEPEKTASGLIYGDGCIPHACGTYDGFMAVDAASQKLYLARQTDGKSPETWPEAGTWPADLRQTMEKALAKSE